MRLVWMQSAVGDLREARAYVADDDASAAARLAAQILEVAEALVTTPSLGRRGRVTGTREIAVPGTPYLLVYRLVADGIQVLRVLHGRRSWPQ